YTPMQSLRLSLQAMLRAMQSGKPRTFVGMGKHLELASRQAERIIKLIGNLLDVSSLETRELLLERADVELGALVRDVVERFELDLTRAHCSVSIHGDAPVVGRWDRSRIDQVVTNLLSNAIKFGAGKPIDIVIGEGAGVARLAVRDNGIGIDPT